MLDLSCVFLAIGYKLSNSAIDFYHVVMYFVDTQGLIETLLRLRDQT